MDNPAPARRPALQTLVVRPLLRDLFSGKLPGGTHLVERDIATRLQISRAPVREALRDIASLGLIELRQNRGAVVLPFGAPSVRGIYRVRMALEADAAYLAAGQVPAAEIAAFEKIFEDLLVNRATTAAWSERAILSDAQFHDMIAVHCRVDRLVMEIRRYNALVGEIREALGARFQFQEEAVQQHVTILRALANTARREAADAMREHIEGATHRAVEALFPKARL